MGSLTQSRPNSLWQGSGSGPRVLALVLSRFIFKPEHISNSLNTSIKFFNYILSFTKHVVSSAICVIFISQLLTIIPFMASFSLILHTVDPQWDIWYWGSKWNLHTVCWSAVGCEWGTTSVYFGITYVCFIPSRRPVFAVEPQYLLQDFYFCQKYHLKDTYKIFKKFHVGLKLNGVCRTKID